ncbi:zinc-binding dehydrogenase [Streptomyces sp. MP131-18]|uniref:zinc-binding dehydrogenase n=1 Tax=Streptomyces sp. MP131-18 TaxID=1857892 RepID=UPI00097C76EF|nr:zinc-binding dehydrogenase [Streptomyces sp. MP131-18]ONK13510.1 Beta-ketoacyl-acyl-carrier-protein synthase I [Streptomyces sp. MP131-18]
MSRCRRIVVDRYGGPDVLRLALCETPAPGPGQVRLRMEAAGLAPADALMRAGRYPAGPRPGFVPGWDVVGRVEAAGPGVPADWEGRRCAALVLRGGHASHLCVNADRLVPVPAGVDALSAACLPLNYVAAHQMLHRLATARAGERVLVSGASGGVGTALLDLARLAGPRAVGTASAGHADVVSAFGAEPVDYRAGDVTARIADLSGGDGVDIALDAVGGATLTGAWRLLRPGGRLVSYGFPAAGLRSRRPSHAVLRQLLRLRWWSLVPQGRSAASYRLSAAARRRPETVQEDLGALVGQLASGRLRPLVAEAFPLERAARAHELLALGRHTGKILLIP